MSKARAQELIDLGNKLFSDKQPIDELNQEIAENVYPERADFTRERYIGENFADHLMDSFPNLARRELGNSISAIMRPRDQHWFATTTLDEDRDQEPENARFLEYITRSVRSAIYHPKANFIASTKSGDHDYVSFGNAVISVEEGGKERNHLFFRGHHLRDCAWLENDISIIDHLHRKDAMTARQVKLKFGEKNLAEAVKRLCKDKPNTNVNLRCIVMPADEYDYIGEGSKAKGGKRLPFVVIYLDADNVKVLKEGGLHDFPYAIPRWARISGIPYAFSPPAMTSLPDARMAQMLASIILEAGEKTVDPPTVAIEEKVREASLQSGSITWVDASYDGKVSDAFAAMHLEGDMRVGFEMRKDVRDILSKAWFLDKLALPEAGKQMTAYETARRVEEHVRNLLPLFEPMEIEYNTQVLDKAFSTMSNMGLLDWGAMPDGLSNADMAWTFKNPMQEASSRILVSQFTESLQLSQAAMQMGMRTLPWHIDRGFKDALRGVSVPADWRKTAEEEEQDARVAAAKEKINTIGSEIAGAGATADQVGKGVQSLQAAGLLPAPQQKLLTSDVRQEVA